MFSSPPLCILYCIVCWWWCKLICWWEIFTTLCLPAAVKTVLEVPMGSRFVRLNAKGPDMIGEWLQFSRYSEHILFFCMFNNPRAYYLYIHTQSQAFTSHTALYPGIWFWMNKALLEGVEYSDYKNNPSTLCFLSVSLVSDSVYVRLSIHADI